MSEDLLVATARLSAIYGTTSAFVDGLSPVAFNESTRCEGWTVKDVLFHVLLDAQRALVALATPAYQPADTTCEAFWARQTAMATSERAAGHRDFVRRAAAAYESPSGLVGQYKDTAAAVVRALRHTEPGMVVHAQADRMLVTDFVNTLIIEAAVHYLDMTLRLPLSPSPGEEMETVRRTLDGLVGEPAYPDWDDITYLLKATGREPLTAEERIALGPVSERFPVIR